LKKTHELKLLPEETVNDRKVFVIDAKPSASAASPLGHATFAFDQERGLVTRVVTFGPDDKPVTTMTFTDLKFNEQIDPKRFEFVTPEGTRLIDQTLPVTPPTRPTTGPATTAPAQE
jgi:outer membrane lipoprotein-sorting protein